MELVRVAFVTAFVLRFSDSLPLVAHAGTSAKADAPSSFVCNVSLVILALLSYVEWWATKDADVRQFLDQFDAPVKSGMALITSLGLASAAIMSDEDRQSNSFFLRCRRIQKVRSLS